MPTAPYDHPLNLTMQAIMTYGSWGLTFVFLGIAIWMGIRQKTPFFVLLLLASMFGAFAEPLYDEGMMLLFYVPGIWSHFTAFEVPQPLWTHSGYAVLYGSAAMWICNQIKRNGLTRAGLYKFAGLELGMSCAFEMIGINGGAYEYWGPHVFRVFEYPIVIGILEAAQVICFSVAAAQLRERVASPIGLLGLFVLFPCTFYLANFGAGAPVIIALHLENSTPAIVTAATLLSIGFALVLIHAAASLLPAGREATARGARGQPLAAH